MCEEVDSRNARLTKDGAKLCCACVRAWGPVTNGESKVASQLTAFTRVPTLGTFQFHMTSPLLTFTCTLNFLTPSHARNLSRLAFAMNPLPEYTKAYLPYLKALAETLQARSGYKEELEWLTKEYIEPFEECIYFEVVSRPYLERMAPLTDQLLDEYPNYYEDVRRNREALEGSMRVAGRLQKNVQAARESNEGTIKHAYPCILGLTSQ